MARPSLQRFINLLGNRSSAEQPGARRFGEPTSSNGASSLHLGWVLPAVRSGGYRELSVTLEVIEPPSVDRLYFWALQADFADGAGRGPIRRAGGAHLGLQWHPQHPGSTAVNWGGYGPDGAELSGSGSVLPSALRNVNTRDFPWCARSPYRLTISRVDGAGSLGSAGGPGGVVGDPRAPKLGPDRFPLWRGSVADVDGVSTVVRDLYAPGDRISGAIMWSEVFARCEHPSVAVRWSDPVAVALDGSMVRPDRVSVNYQARADGGCTNTDSRVDGVGVVQWTNAERTTPQGAALGVPASNG